MNTNYQKLTEKYLSIAKQITKELQTNKRVIGCAVIGSVAKRDVHSLSDIDLIILVKGNGVYRWERKIVKNIIVNIAYRSQDVLEKMAKEHPDTIFALKNALILYDSQGVLNMLKENAIVTEPVREELLGDLLDEARSFIGKGERALAESRLESSALCLRLGAIKLAEYIIYKETGRKVSPMYLWQEIKSLPILYDFRRVFAEVQGFDLIKKAWLKGVLNRLKEFLPELEG